MTRKDYVKLAAAVTATKAYIVAREPDEDHANMIDGASLVAEHLADTLAADNPRFDRARFLKACGVTA